MSAPRNLATTLPSPSELNNYHKCPCYWWLHDRLWIKPVGDRMGYLFGRLLDKTMEQWQLKKITNPLELLKFFDDLSASFCVENTTEATEEEHALFSVSVRDAISAWLTLYANVEEEIILAQGKFSLDATIKVDYLVRVPPGLIRIRDRKMLSPFADIDHEIERYQLGFQPLAYAEQIEKITGEPVECVEFEFFIRSAPQKGRFKAIPASIRREPIYVEDWKKRLWRSSAEFTNFTMQSLQTALVDLTSYENDPPEKGVPFELIPRHTMNCFTKLGKKTYKCDYFKCCSTNTSPLLMPEHFYDGGKDQDEASNCTIVQV